MNGHRHDSAYDQPADSASDADGAHLPTAIGQLRGNRVLIDGVIRAADMRIDGERIGHAGAGHLAVEPGQSAAGAVLDAGNLLVLPGIVDLHGDAFERSVMPRPGVSFSYDQALQDVDRQLLGNGITTEFHGVTLSWEQGLRGAPYAERMFDALARNRSLLGAQHQIHLRFETHNLADVALACEWIGGGKVQFLALNDHLPSMVKRLGNDRKLLQYAERAECDLDTFSARIRLAVEATPRVPAAVRSLVDAALAAGLKVASHDDETVAVREAYHAIGCGIAEFPTTPEAAEAARRLGNAIVFGAPNVVRGRSHTTAPNATDMIRAGLCDILTSDYYYPAPLAAALRLDEMGVLPLEQAWRLVSRNPALAAGLTDRGELAAGLRADMIVVDDRVAGAPRVCAAVVGGRLRYANGLVPLYAAPVAASGGLRAPLHAEAGTLAAPVQASAV